MYIRTLPRLAAALLLLGACKSPQSATIKGVEELLVHKVTPMSMPAQLEKIAFGSCQSQDQSLLTLTVAIEQDPDLFIYLGDNIYGDTEDMKILAAKYSKLGGRQEFVRLNKTCPLLATWDDHDYGANDSGREYPQKENSKSLFLDFWGEPKDSERRKHKGIYTSYMIGAEGKKVQIILLDTRTFRSPLLPAGKDKQYRNDYRPNNDNSATILGDEQWKWLGEQLEQSADLRIIGSSTQFGIEYNGYEAWANFPLEQEKMLKLIRDKKAEHLVFISGDVHYAELSKLNFEGLYPIYDLTSSGINRDWPHVEPNKNRDGEACSAYNFGLLQIDWEKKSLNFRITDAYKKVHLDKNVRFEELEFPK